MCPMRFLLALLSLLLLAYASLKLLITQEDADKFFAGKPGRSWVRAGFAAGICRMPIANHAFAM